jgi:predicted phosphodiesterase
MMKIGVISDTHLREPHLEFKKLIESHFKDVEKIFHAGDLWIGASQSIFRARKN